MAGVSLARRGHRRSRPTLDHSRMQDVLVPSLLPLGRRCGRVKQVLGQFAVNPATLWPREAAIARPEPLHKLRRAARTRSAAGSAAHKLPEAATTSRSWRCARAAFRLAGTRARPKCRGLRGQFKGPRRWRRSEATSSASAPAGYAFDLRGKCSRTSRSVSGSTLTSH